MQDIIASFQHLFITTATVSTLLLPPTFLNKQHLIMATENEDELVDYDEEEVRSF